MYAAFSKGTKAAAIVDAVSGEVFRLLLGEGRPFAFLAGKAARRASRSPERRRRKIRTRSPTSAASSPATPTRACRPGSPPRGCRSGFSTLYLDARTLEEEQGVNILYLTLGALKWVDSGHAANVRYAPLVLVPAQLARGNAGEKSTQKAS